MDCAAATLEPSLPLRSGVRKPMFYTPLWYLYHQWRYRKGVAPVVQAGATGGGG
jgi:hypothetical protein